MALTVIRALTTGMFAASNPIYLKLRKYDWQYSSVATYMDGLAVLVFDQPFDEVLFQDGQFIRVVGGIINGTYEIIDVFGGGLELRIDLAYDAGMAADSGYVINTEAYPLPYIETEIYHGSTYIGTLYNSPDLNGLITIDFSRMVKSLLNKENESDYDQINFLDENLSSYFKYRYLEHWSGSETDTPTPQWTAFSNNIYIAQVAKQLGDAGISLQYYSISIYYLLQTNPPDVFKNAKFLTQFIRPKYFKNYPFDLSFLWQSGLGVDQPEIVITKTIRHYSINKNIQVSSESYIENLENDLGYGVHRMIFELPENAYSFYFSEVEVSEAGGFWYIKFIDYTDPDGVFPINTDIAVIISTSFSRYNNQSLPYYTSARGGGERSITLLYGVVEPIEYHGMTGYLYNSIQSEGDYVLIDFTVAAGELDLNIISQLRLDLDYNCYDNPIYLCWLNTLGGWDYWLFHTYYEDNVSVNDSQIMKKHISDYANDTTQKDVVKKTPEPYYILGADNLTTQQVNAIKNLSYSPKVMMLTNRDEWIDGRNDSPPVTPKWITVIVRDMDFKHPKGRNATASVEFEIELPTINVQ